MPFAYFKDITNNTQTHSGTGNTIPFSCVDDVVEAVTLSKEIVLGQSSDVALGRICAAGEIRAHMCFKKANETGRLMGTAFVARDLISVVDALKEDGMLRYWGNQDLRTRVLSN
jgi:hypothetical protein